MTLHATTRTPPASTCLALYFNIYTMLCLAILKITDERSVPETEVYSLLQIQSNIYNYVFFLIQAKVSIYLFRSEHFRCVSYNISIVQPYYLVLCKLQVH